MDILIEITYYILPVIFWLWILVKLWSLFMEHLLHCLDIMPAKQTEEKERKAKGKTVDFEILEQRGLLNHEEI